MKKIFVLIGLLYIIIINSGCPKPCVEANLSFNVNFQISPDLDSVHVGDTIYLISSFPTKLTEQTSGQIMDYSNSTGIGSTLAVSSLPQGDTIAADAVFDFEYVNVNGRIYNDRSIPRPDGVQQLSYQETNGSYILRIGLIPKRRGDFILGIGNGLSNGRNKNGNCTNATFNISVSNTNQHFNLLNEWKPGNILNDFGKNHGYAFKVY